MARFSFPVPGRKPKQSAGQQATSVPLTKAQKILGTGGINTDRGGSASQQPWDSRSGISISVSESSASHSTTDTGLDIVNEEDNGTAGTSYGANGWDDESEILPRQMRGWNGPRPQMSAATIGNDYRTDASSLRRRQSNASTIYSHYDRSKVPLSISQQTSNSAMAKGLPNNKANSLLDMDGTLAGPTSRKKKPAKLDLSILKPRRRWQQGSRGDQVLGNEYVTRSPSFMSHISSPSHTPRKLKKSPSTTSTATYGSPLGPADSTTLSQLYEHYEQMSFRSAPSPNEEDSERPGFDTVAEEEAPPALTPALTTSSTLSLVTPLSNPMIREPNRHLGHFRKGSTGSRNTVTTTSSKPSLVPSQHLSPGLDCASSISSRNTRASKNSRTMESDLQTTSVLSLSDSESDDGAFSDSAPKSSMSSHTNVSHDDGSIGGESRKAASIRSPAIQDRSSSRQKHQSFQSFAPLNDYLAVPASAGNSKGHKARVPSNSTLRSYSSSTSTATATGNSNSGSYRASRLSVETTETSRSHPSQGSYKKHYSSSTISQEAKTVTMRPLASTAEALDSLRELAEQATSSHAVHSDQLTPPLSPSSMASYISSPVRKNIAHDETEDAQNARLMAVTKQEEMLLAALRQKRAMMRESMRADAEKGDKGSIKSSRTSMSSGDREPQLQARTYRATSFGASSGAPQLPPIPSRDSSLVSSFKNLTERRDSVRRTDNNVRFAAEPHGIGHRESALEKRSSSAMSDATIMGNSAGRKERVLLFLDRPISDFDDAFDAAEPSPDLSEFMSYDQDSDGEILPERRRSRRGSRFNSVYGNSASASRRSEQRPRADSNLLGARGSGLRMQLENLPESHMENNEEADIDFDGFSDVMDPPRSEASAGESNGDYGFARPDSPVQQPAAPTQRPKGHIKSKNSAVRLSAVGNVGLFLPPEAGLWGDDG